MLLGFLRVNLEQKRGERYGWSGGKSCVVGGEHDVTIALDIAEFWSLVMGAVRFKTLFTSELAATSTRAIWTRSTGCSFITSARSATRGSER